MAKNLNTIYLELFAKEGVEGIYGFEQEEYNFLSNFHPCELTIEGITYQNVEQAFQAAKTLNVEDKKFISTLTAGKAKRYGRKVQMRDD